MEHRESPVAQSRLTELREKLGMMVGRRPEWFNQAVWDGAGSTEKRVIARLHYKGRAGFAVIPSAEIGMKNYHRTSNS